MFQDGWVCRACWKPNRPGDDRCYRCKTPREEQLTVKAGSLKERATPGWEKTGRMDLDLGILAALVAWPMRLSGVSLIGLAIFGAFLALVAGDRVTSDGMSTRLVFTIAAAAFVVLGMLWIFVSRSVRRQARWAYAIAIPLYGVPSLLSLLFPVPAAIREQSELAVVVDAVLQWVYLVLAFMAALLLGASFMRSNDADKQGRATDTAR